MGKHWRKTIGRCTAVVLAVAAIIPVATGLAVVTEASAVPAKVVGVWTRNVTRADWTRYGPGSREPVGVWTMVVKKRGDVALYPPGKYRAGCKACVSHPDFFSIVDLALIIGPDARCPGTKGIYHWEAVGRALTIMPIAENKQCWAREATFSGVWKRK